MIEAIAIIAIGTVILLYAQRQSERLLSNRITNSVAMKVEQMLKMKQKLKDCKTGITLRR